ncbi:MAG TPA: hypothetical protein VMI09_01465, partial [Candidatus Binataceae bacterium]|nr:hypothetical protein [Candidatus Binataceae bacterium]
QHEALRLGVPHVGVGHFSIGDPGQFCIGGNTERTIRLAKKQSHDKPYLNCDEFGGAEGI